MKQEIPPPPGCWRLLLGFPVLVFISWIEEPWRKLLQPHLPPRLSADAAAVIYAMSLLAMMFAAWMAILKVVDLMFGSKLYPYASHDNTMPPAGRARLRRHGFLTIVGVVAADQATKYAYGIAHAPSAATPAALSPDASLIVNCAALLVFFLAWLRSGHRLEATALSLVVGGTASGVFDQATRKAAVLLQIRAFGLAPVFSLAEPAVLAGLVLFAVSWFWEPKVQAPPAPGP